MNNSNSRYNSPMVDLKKWYENVILDAGRLTSMKDPELQRMYASTVVNSMDHLLHALDEKINMVEEADKRRDLTFIKNAVVRSMEHVKKDFTITGPPYVKYPWKNDNSSARATLAQIQQTLANSIGRVNTGASVLKTNTALSANGAISAASLAAANEAATEAANEAATEAANEATATAALEAEAANEATGIAALEAENENENAFSLSGNNSTPDSTATGNTARSNTAAQGGRRHLNKKRATRKNKKSRRQAKKSRRQLK
jgi:hypothetical protein